MSILNSKAVADAIQNSLDNRLGKCQCKLKGTIEGMDITVGEIFEYSDFLDPDNNTKEYLLIIDDIPLVVISEDLFNQHFSK